MRVFYPPSSEERKENLAAAQLHDPSLPASRKSKRKCKTVRFIPRAHPAALLYSLPEKEYAAAMQAALQEADIFRIERPSSNLMVYYAISLLWTGPFYPLFILPRIFKYRTLRYHFSQDGISMRWGILFRREVIINYWRIQDIHLRSNVIERWLDLARIQIQTASGSAQAEMVIEGLHQFEAIRDFLYSKMRGMKEKQEGPPVMGAIPARSTGMDGETAGQLAAALQAVTAELRAVRQALEKE
jgi:membrane protein YdbS with pleckstrin-like domain